MNPSARFAYLAGLIDGEGSVWIQPIYYVRKLTGERRTSYLLNLSVFNTHYGLMEWLKRNFGGVVGRARETGHGDVQWKPSYRWEVSAKKAASLIRACQKYLIIKREHAAVALEFDRLKVAPGDSRERTRPPEYFERQAVLYAALKVLNRRGLPVTTNTPPSDESEKRESELLGDEQSESREASSRAH